MRVEPYWISHQAAGRLAIIPRPRPNDWLEDELLAWKRADIEIVVSCLTGFEVMALGLQKEKAMCEENQMHFVSFPIEDRQVPASQIATLDLTRELLGWLNEGKTIAIHCRQGVGRSSLVAACVLVALGKEVDAAFTTIEKARGVPVSDTPAQVEWVRWLSSRLVKIVKK